MFETIPMRAGKVSLHCNGGRFRGGLAVARLLRGFDKRNPSQRFGLLRPMLWIHYS